MATLRDALLPPLHNNWRRIIQDLGFRTNTVTIIVQSWAQGLGVGSPTVISSLTIDPIPKVREVNQREVAGSGGRYVQGDLRIGPVTPHFDTPAPGGGFTEAEFAPSTTAANVEVIYRVVGPTGGDYRRVDFKGDRALGYTVTVTKRRRPV